MKPFYRQSESRPEDNKDTIKRRKHPALIYRFRRWSTKEINDLKFAVRMQNQRILAETLFKK